MKRFLAVWLCLSVGLGSLVGAFALFLRKSTLAGEAKTLIQVASSDYDITKIKSPSVIEDALNALNMDVSQLETLRNALDIHGVIPTDAYEQMSMYYGIAEQNTDAIRSLLNTNYDVLRYIVTLDYSKASLSRTEGAHFLDALLRSYQEYCLMAYHDNAALKNPLSAIDYREYDYAEAANIFSDTLESVSDYLSRVSGEPMADAYRSAETGFTFGDLMGEVSSLKEIELDRVTSYIVIHSVSANEPDAQISYYAWMIENLDQQRAIQRARLAALTDSIESYDKDSLVILTGQDGVSAAAGPENINANYDAMIQEKLDTQALISSYNRSISYYEAVIQGFRQADQSPSYRDRDIAEVRGYLEDLNGKLDKLIQNVSLTVNEYYEQAAFSNQVCALVPAVFEAAPSSLIVKAVGLTEGALLALYLVVSFAAGIRDANNRREESSDEEGV